jgi:hypothetical protein
LCGTTPLQILLAPGALAGHNTISRNLGDNRARGAHPRLLLGPIR